MPPQPTPPLTRQPELAEQDRVSGYKRLLDWLVPVLAEPVGPPHISVHLLQVRERILTGLLRIAVALGTLALLVSILPPLIDTPPAILVLDFGICVAIWVVALRRSLVYRLRAGVLVAGLYIISCIELTYYGFSQDAAIEFLFCTLMALLFFNHRVGLTILALSVTTLASLGALISTGRFTPLAHPVAELSLSTMITTCLLFVMIAGSVQAGVALLLDHLDLALQREYRARRLLEADRDLLEQRVAARTHDLALARDQALAASQAEAAQKEYLAALYQTTLDLLHRHELGDILQTLIDRSAVVLDAPYGEIMLHHLDELVVRAFTANQPFLRGDRVQRGTALLTWQAFDSRQPAIVADYSAWAARRAIYADVPLAAVADFPILLGERCIGVLALGRDVPGQVFTPDDIQKGTLFAQLAALVVENAQLYDTARREIGERVKAEQALQAQNAELEAFARTVAHDLKSPLTGVLGNSQMLLEIKRLLRPEEIDESLQAIARASQKMATIIDELLLLARVRSQAALPCTAVAMAEVVAEAELRMQHAIRASGARLDYPAQWPVARGYAPWLEEVWANYLSNALKYGGEPPMLRLGAETLEGGWCGFGCATMGQG